MGIKLITAQKALSLTLIGSAAIAPLTASMANPGVPSPPPAWQNTEVGAAIEDVERQLERLNYSYSELAVGSRWRSENISCAVRSKRLNTTIQGLSELMSNISALIARTYTTAMKAQNLSTTDAQRVGLALARTSGLQMEVISLRQLEQRELQKLQWRRC